MPSKYNYAIFIPQYNTEEILYNFCIEKGIKITWNTKVDSVTQDVEGVTINCTSLEEESNVTYRAKWVLGCDGGHSQVRRSLNMEFTGENLEALFIMASVKISMNAQPVDNVALFIDDGANVLLPEPGGRARIILSYPWKQKDEVPEHPSLEFISELLEKKVPYHKFELSEPHWLTRFEIHERIISSYRNGRVFFAGDAAHTHSPFGGQGMNTGMQDVYNLAWKLGLVYRGIGSTSLLDTYNEERHPVAAALLKNTTLQTKIAASSNAILTVIRNAVVTNILPFGFVQDAISPGVGMLNISYAGKTLGNITSSSMMKFLSREKLSPGDFITKLTCKSSIFPKIEKEIDLKSILTGNYFNVLLICGLEMAIAAITNMNEVAKAIRRRGYPASTNFLKICVILPPDHEKCMQDVLTTPECEDLYDYVVVDSDDLKIHEYFGVYSGSGSVLIRPDWHLGVKLEPASANIVDYLRDKILV